MKVGTTAALAVGVVVLAISFFGSDDEGSGAHRTGASVAEAALEPAPAARPSRGRKNPPVVILLLDEFPPDSLIGRGGRIDAARYPNFAQLAREGYWFPNATTIYDSTTKAIPILLDGELPTKGTKATYGYHPDSIYTTLARRGYRIVDSEEATSMCPPSLCPGVKDRDGMILERLAGGRENRLHGWMDKIGPQRRTLYVKHAMLPHSPWIYLPSGRQHRIGPHDPVRGLASPRGFGDRDLLKVNQLRHLLQVGYVDSQVGRLRRRMEKMGTWNESLVVVAADHGYAFQLDVTTRRLTNRSNIHQIAPVPLFIKAPFQRQGRTIHSYVRTLDVVPTIADILNISPGYPLDGDSAFSRPSRRRGHVRVIDRHFNGAVTISARAIARRRQAEVRRKLRLFGVGPSKGEDWRLYRGIGPNRELLGQPVGAVASAARTSTRAELAATSARDLARVDLSSRLRPNHIAGTLSPSGRKRDIAVAVNGTIQAVGRTFYLDESDDESFAVLVPEWVLEEGRNDVRVFQVLRRRGSLRLRPLS